jgi:hypothetical protein
MDTFSLLLQIFFGWTLLIINIIILVLIHGKKKNKGWLFVLISFIATLLKKLVATASSFWLRESVSYDLLSTVGGLSTLVITFMDIVAFGLSAYGLFLIFKSLQNGSIKGIFGSNQSSQAQPNQSSSNQPPQPSQPASPPSQYNQATPSSNQPNVNSSSNSGGSINSANNASNPNDSNKNSSHNFRPSTPPPADSQKDVSNSNNNNPRNSSSGNMNSNANQGRQKSHNAENNSYRPPSPN